MVDLRHLWVAGREESHQYTSPSRARNVPFDLPPRDRRAHAASLASQLSDALDSAASKRGLSTQDPRIVTYELIPQAIEKVVSLERPSSGIELLNVVDEGPTLRATVRIPYDRQNLIESVIQRYATEQTKSGKPKNQPLVESIESIRLATEADLWTDALPFPGMDEKLWWEVWLPSHAPAQDAFDGFAEHAAKAGFQVKKRFVTFPDRVVALAWGDCKQWAADPTLLLRVAELRRAKTLAAEYTDLDAATQGLVVDELLRRLTYPDESAPAVCLLDTGVDNGHPLIEPALAPTNALTIQPEWGAADHHSQKHGTSMAGIALFGDALSSHLDSDDEMEIRTRLESVKILPPAGPNDPELYGAITAEAVARAEEAAPSRRRAICMTPTADSRDGGLPSSWSGAVDQIACGGPLAGEPKLFCVAAGNLREQIRVQEFTYPMLEGDLAGVEDPGQAWNALTVGAMTNKVSILDDGFNEYEPIAPPGDLSPISRTSLAWPESQRKGWPLKPDIVAEGGNWAQTDGHIRDCPDDLLILSTALRPNGGLFTTVGDTSPATASVARVAATLLAEYPEMWPETARGLIVHSARWTDAMLERFPGSAKDQVKNRLRCYGYGVPNLDRALYSANNSATLIHEGALQPFHRPDSDVKTNEMHLHPLPWPTEVLEDLAAEDVTVRITLSYFIEPSPGRKGWKKRHRYASHGLRFRVKRPTETQDGFLARVNDATATEYEDLEETSGDPLPWVVGVNGRTRGSLHCDWFTMTAAQVAQCGCVAVYPVTGWWRERAHLNRWDSQARYSLVVSLETPATTADLYTSIANEIAAETQIQV